MKRSFQRTENFTIDGKNGNLEIEGFPARLWVRYDEVTIEGYENIYWNGREAACKGKINNGDELSFSRGKIIFLEKSVQVECEDTVNINTDGLLELEEKEIPFEGYPKYKRSPRIIKRIPDLEISLTSPKEQQNGKKESLVQLIVPPLVMLCVTVGISILMKRGLYVLMSAAGTVMTTIFTVVKYITDRKEGQENKRLREKTYREYLLKKRKEIYAAYQNEEEANHYNYPEVKELARMVGQYSPRIYERSSDDDDFLNVSLGQVMADCHFRIRLSTDELKDKPDELELEAQELKREFSKMKQPVVVDLKKAHLGLVGEKSVIHEQLKLLVAQLTFFQSYHDLEIVTIYNNRFDADFQWMRWYPHLRIHAVNVVGTVNSERKRDQILGSLHQMIKNRKNKLEESKKESRFLPHLIFIIDEPKLIMDHSIMEYLDKEGDNLGFSIIYTTNMRANLPENIGTIVMLHNSGQATLLMEEKEEKNLSFELSDTSGINLEWMARNLSTLEHMQGISAQIPESITFFEMYQVEHPEELDIAKRWKKNHAAKSLAVPLGVRAKEDYVNLNLHEKAHGPHGLVAGTTGSGKSEIIQSYILSLAVNYHPYEVAFLLIDYKGGGMAGLFRNLPHLLGTITNLDGAQSMRAMASIKSELARRQKIFSSYDVNHINAYHKLFQNGEAKEPLPHLFIISDEFAELKKEQPDFMTELVSAARIGRSLGVHLILATQKPTGVVDDQIWTNSKFKLALMVQNEADSKEILKTPDAANITIPGRAYLQVGNNEIYELFQSAWSGASYVSEKEEEKVDDRVYLVNDLGQGELINEDLSDEHASGGNMMTQLDATVDYIHRVYEAMDTVEVKRPWMPPLPEQIVSDQQAEKGNALNLTTRIGKIDIPEEQQQVEYQLNFATDGNLLYIASAGYGKTAFLTTVLLSLAMHNRVENLNFYILDFGNSGLIPLNRLHHTADYISFDDTERFRKFCNLIQAEIKRRKKLLAERMVQNFEVYNQVAEKTLKAIVIAIDNYDVVKELGYEAEEFFQKLSRDGTGLGIYMAATATRSNAMKYSTYNNFKNKVAGYLFDESDLHVIVGRSSYSQSEIKGRTLIKYNGLVSVMQVYVMTAFTDELEYNQGIEACIEQINTCYPDTAAPRIPVLPDELNIRTFMEMIKKQHTAEENAAEKAIWLGLNKESVLPECIPAGLTTPFVILGETARGKTNALKVILEQITGRGKVYLLDSKDMELYHYRSGDEIHYIGADGIDAFLMELGGLVTARNQQLQQKMKEHPEQLPRRLVQELDACYVVVDEWDDFVEATKLKAVLLAPILSGALSSGIRFILTANSGKLKGFDEITKFAKATTDGLLVGNPGSTGIFGTVAAKELPQLSDGLLFHNGAYVRIRIPKCEDREE